MRQIETKQIEVTAVWTRTLFIYDPNLSDEELVDHELTNMHSGMWPEDLPEPSEVVSITGRVVDPA